jgi:hypothetical protein
MARTLDRVRLIASVTAGVLVVAALTGAPALGQQYPAPRSGGYPRPSASPTPTVTPTPSRAAYPAPYPGPRTGQSLRVPAVYRNSVASGQ